MLKLKYILAVGIFLCTILPGWSQEPILDAGIRIQKTVNLYLENGISLQYSSPKIKHDQLYFGLSCVSSRFGTALNSNAIKQTNWLISCSYFFRKEKLIRPMGRLNLGYFHSDYEYQQFDVLPNQSLLISPEIGVSIEPAVPLKFSFSFGYNVITGNGEEGPGTLYPMFLQTTVLWRIFK